MDHNQELAQLIGSRICHDLVSPIGAIGNGLELMQMTSGALSPEMSLIQESLDHANARIRLFRLAFGRATAMQQIGASEISGLLADIGRTGRVSYHWNGPNAAPRTEVQAVCLAAMCLERCLPYGGRIQITNEGSCWHLTADGRKLLWDAETWQALIAMETVPEAANEVEFALLQNALHRLGRRPVAECFATLVSLRF
ncbi:histidine phosphotransferase family protein [Thalassobius sp. MITS945101]|uniref:histidine phosphotransferase family protein n=1 Tax=Thalassobius sp. MITS945101 TaxID=3096994 RepID=UPI00399A28DE